MIKQTKKTYGGMVKDISPYQTPGANYYDAKYGRITATNGGTEFSFTNVKGTKQVIQFPWVKIGIDKITYNDKVLPLKRRTKIYEGDYGEFKICGSIVTTRGLVLFTHSGIASLIWLYSNDELTLLYANDLGFRNTTYITALANYETDKIEKIYWVDAVNQIRFLNINQSIANGDDEELQDTAIEMLDAKSPYKLSQPVIREVTSGGNHTAGMIQYAYSLYKKNGSQTNISALSDLVPLKNSDSGANVNELVSTIPVVQIENLDTEFDNVRVYSVKYTTLDTEPTISIINDSQIPNNGTLVVYDTNKVISTISTEEFVLDSASTIYIPSDIEVKDNRLFLSSYDEKNFIFKLDMRAFSFNSSRSARIFHNLKSLDDWESTKFYLPDNLPYDNDEKYDSINLFHDQYKYKANGVDLGATGRYCEFGLTYTRYNNGTNRFLRDNDIYRLGIVFFNAYGKTCDPIWINDFQAPDGNLRGMYNILNFNLTNDFYNKISEIDDPYLRPVGYKLLIAEKEDKDRYVINSGILSTMMINHKKSIRAENLETKKRVSREEVKLPNFLLRNYVHTSNDKGIAFPLRKINDYEMMHSYEVASDGSYIYVKYKDSELMGDHVTFGARSWQYNNMIQMYSPEAVFNKSVTIPGENCRIRLKGAFKNTDNNVWNKVLTLKDHTVTQDVKGFGGIHPQYSQRFEENVGNVIPYAFEWGLVAHPGGTNVDKYHRTLWYRKYGIKNIEGVDSNDPDGFISIPVSRIVLTRTKDYARESTKDVTANNVPTLMHEIDASKVKSMRFYLTELSIKPNDIETTYDFSEWYNIYSCGGFGAAKRSLTGNYVEGESEHYTTLSNFEYVNGVFNSSMGFSLNPINRSQMSGKFRLGFKIKMYDSANEEILDYDGLIDEDFYINRASTITPDLYQKSTRNFICTIKGKPEYTSEGQSYKNYANLGNYRYVNNLQSVKTDGDTTWKEDGQYGRRTISINAKNSGCVTIVPENSEGGDISLKTMIERSGISLDNSVPVAEILRSDKELYLGGLYGGNKYEEKLRTRYREIGVYTKLNKNNPYQLQTINSPGEVFVQVFKFLRMSKFTEEIVQGVYQMEEIVEYPTETTIDLSSRNDESSMEWDGKLFYESKDYHKYNTVYSQLNSLVPHQASEYYTKDYDKFGSTVIPSREKNAGELIDNWLHPLPNDSLTLDGKYGKINKLINFNDSLVAFQDKALALLSVNPRIQMPTEDGIGLQLGTGAVLPDYKYLSQDSGTMSKHSIKRTPYGVYYFDNYNKSINVFNGKIAPLSETGGVHSYLQGLPLKEIEVNDYRNSQGIITGYDSINKDVYMTFNFDNFTDTIVYNEKRNLFIDREDHKVTDYIDFNDKLYTTNNQNKLSVLGDGEYNNFFGAVKNTSVTFIINPEVDMDTVLNTIMFKSSVKKNNIDQPNSTITHYRVFNEFQDTGYVEVDTSRRGNARRFLRDWNVSIGRNKGTRERIRNPYNYLELVFDNPDNKALVLDDIIVSYTV